MASIFSKIIAREMPGHFIWEDDLCIAIMTIMPIRDGHCMVIPKEEVNHWDDVPEETARHLMTVSQRVAKAVKAVVPCKRIGVSIVGIEVPHTHIHLMPLHTPADMDFKNARTVTEESLESHATRIREQLLSIGYTQAQVGQD